MRLLSSDSLFCMATTLKLFHSKLQTINFTEPFYAPPVVLVTPKHSGNNNNSNLSGSRCNAVTAWVEVRNKRELSTAKNSHHIRFLWSVANGGCFACLFVVLFSKPFFGGRSIDPWALLFLNVANQSAL